MQWLINIIKEIIHGQLGCFNRGNVPTYDFITGDFTKDNAWHNLDLSSIIPIDAKAVLVRLRLKTTTAGKVVRFATNGAASGQNVSLSGTIVANLFHWFDIIIIPDTNRVITYKISIATWTNLDFTVAGWWLR